MRAGKRWVVRGVRVLDEGGERGEEGFHSLDAEDRVRCEGCYLHVSCSKSGGRGRGLVLRILVGVLGVRCVIDAWVYNGLAGDVVEVLETATDGS